MGWEIGQELVLTKSVSRALPFIRGAVAVDYGATATYELLQSLGMGGRKSTVLEAYKALSYAYQDPSVYLPSDPDIFPRSDLIPLAITQQRNAYQSVVSVTIFNSSDNVLEERFVTIGGSELLTASEYMRRAEELAVTYEDLESPQREFTYIDSINYSENPIYG